MKLDADRKAKLLFAAVLVAGMLALGAWAVFDSLGYATYQIETHDWPTAHFPGTGCAVPPKPSLNA